MFLRIIGLIAVFIIGLWFAGAAFAILCIGPMWGGIVRKSTTAMGFVFVAIACYIFYYVFGHFNVSLS